MSNISMLELRRIEAAILKDVYDVAVERLGEEEAREIISQAVSNSAIAQGKSMRGDQKEQPDLEDFADLIPLWELNGVLEVDILHRSKERLDFNVNKCSYSEMYREMGLGEIGHLLSCNRDGAFCIGYNPDMELTRTQTIMKGAKSCDFRYTLKK